MATITITFDDTPAGCKIVGSPPLEEIVRIAQEGGARTSAQGYAMVAWVAIMQTSNSAHADIIRAGFLQ